MKPHLLATVSTLALAGVASAADLPARMPTKAPAAPVVANWTGFYVGVNGGAVWHRAKFDGAIPDIASTTFWGTAEPTGGTFGGQIGYNWQTQNFVLGVEADWNWVGADGSASVSSSSGCTVCVLNTDLSWLATVRGRVGVLISPPTLIYATGGYAAGRVENSTNSGGGFVNHETRSGWTAGGGIEHRFAPQWSVKAEALYVDLGSTTVGNSLGSGYAGTFDNTAVVARAGLNFKF